MTSPSRKPSKLYSFQAKCEFFILDMDMEIYHSSYKKLYRTTEDLFTGLAEQAKLKEESLSD